MGVYKRKQSDRWFAVSSADSATQAAGPKEFEQLPNEGIDCCDSKVEFSNQTSCPEGSPVPKLRYLVMMEFRNMREGLR
jgi:hypothetical protein